MKKLVYSLLTAVLAISTLLVACAQPTPSPTPTTAPAGTLTPAPGTSPIPTAAPGETPQYGGVLKVEGPQPRTLIPETNNIKTWFNQAAYDTLLRLDEKGELAPLLATDWKLSPDLKSLTLTLRKGVKFHDGTDFNAAAVKFNLLNRKVAKVGDYETLESVDVIDDYTVRLNFSQWQNTVLSSLWYIGGMITSPTTYNKLGRDKALLYPAGTGPFKFVRYDVDQLVKYERFDGYWQQGKPYLDGFELYIITDANTREMAFRAGEIHAAGLAARLLPEFEKMGYPVIDGTVEMYQGLMPDSANASSPFFNKKVREAVDYAIDKEAIVNALGFGRMEVSYQMTSSDTYAYVPDLKVRRYDPAKAKQLLAEAGYPNGFKMTLINVGTASDPEVAAVTYLKEVGIEVTVDAATMARYYTFSQQGWNNGLLRRVFRIPPDWLNFAYAYTSTTAIESKSMLRPPGYQELLEQALAAPDMASKKALSQQIVKLLHDEALFLGTWAAKSSLVTQKNVHNLEYYLFWHTGHKLWGPADVWLSK